MGVVPPSKTFAEWWRETHGPAAVPPSSWRMDRTAPEPKPADLDPEAWPPIGPPPGAASRAVVAAVACYFACAAVVVVSLIGIAAFVFAPLYLVARMIGRIP